MFEETGTVYDNYNHGALGNYHNWLNGTNQPYELSFYAETYPPSQLKGTSIYETYYIEYTVNSAGSVIGSEEVPVTYQNVEGGNGLSASMTGTDGNSKYRTMSEQYDNFLFHCRFTNRVESVSGNAYFGERQGGTSFYFISNGSRYVE